MSITNNTLNGTQRQEDFIMLPTNDVWNLGCAREADRQRSDQLGNAGAQLRILG